jgi:hypothetical protein
MKYITFRNCIIFSVIDFVYPLISAILKRWLSVKNIAPLPYLQSTMFFLLNLYIYIGFIKYSVIRHEQRLGRRIPWVILILAVNFALVLYFTSSMFNYLSPMPLAYLALYYSFRLIHNEEEAFFKKLAEFNLYTFLITALFGFSNLPGMNAFVVSTRWFFFFPLCVTGMIIATIKFYWQVRLFMHLSVKCDKRSIPLNV